MKIIRQKTGVTCVALLDDELIFVDPDLSDPRDVVHAIHEALPDVHLDAIGHWVEEVMPTAAPLSVLKPRPAATRPNRKSRRRTRSAGRAGLQLGSMATAAAAAAALTVVGMSVVPGASETPAIAAEAWDNEVFARVQTGSAWDCMGTDSSDLVATCVTPDGTTMHAEAWVGPNSLTFVFTYRDPRTGLQHRNTLKVFSSEGGVRAWLNSKPTDARLIPNLVSGERWVMYGTDPGRIQRWSARLDDDVVLPADFSEAAFEMGLLPSPEARESNRREMGHVPAIVRQTVARILVGDRTLPIPMNTPTHPAGPVDGVDFPFPGRPVALPPVSAPTPRLPGIPAPTPAPTPTPTPDPTPTPLPTTDPIPTPVPTEPTPTPVPTSPAEVPPPTTDPATQQPSSPDSEQTTEPLPSVDPAPSETTEPATDQSAEPATVNDLQSSPQQPAAEPTTPPEVVEPEQGPAQPIDALTDPIEVPADERAPLYEEGVQTPIFSSVAADMAVQHSKAPQHSRAPQHAKGLPFAA